MTADTTSNRWTYDLPRLSATSIDRFRQCPAAFKAVNLDQVRGQQPVSAAIVQGNAVHHALERFFGLPVEHRQPEMLERALRSVWVEHRHPAAFTSREAEAACGRGALAMLARFAENYDLCALPVARERWVSARLGDGCRFYGKVDRIDRTPLGLDVIDYKTGRITVEQEDLPSDTAAQLYALLVASAFSEPVARIRYLYLDAGIEARWEPEDEDLDAAAERLLTHAEQIADSRHTGEWEARPGEHCRWCPVALACAERDRVDPTKLKTTTTLPF